MPYHTAALADALDRVNRGRGHNVWYRVEAGHEYLFLLCYNVVRVTKAGVWLDNYGKEKFVLASAHKRWACPTVEEACESFRRRKIKEHEILTARIKRIEKWMKFDAEKLVRLPDWIMMS